MVFGTVIQDLTALTTALTSLLILVGTIRNKRAIGQNLRAIGDIHDEVKTQNGLTMAALADRQEGRRVKKDIQKSDRTTSEQHYVDALDNHPNDSEPEGD
jgi:hypothetical protein